MHIPLHDREYRAFLNPLIVWGVRKFGTDRGTQLCTMCASGTPHVCKKLPVKPIAFHLNTD